MLQSTSIYSIALFLSVLSLNVVHSHDAIPAAHQQSSMNQRGNMEMFDALFGRTNDPALIQLKTLQALPDFEKMVNDTIAKYEVAMKVSGVTDAQRKDLEKKIEAHNRALKSIYTGLDNSFKAKAGRIIAGAVGGSDGKYIDNSQIGSIKEGLELGALMRVSKSVGDTVGKRVGIGVEGTLGGVLDLIINGIGYSWSSVINMILYDDQEPFDCAYLKLLWAENLATMTDLGRLVSNGLRDTMRTSHDMALRQAPVAQEDVPGAGAWLKLTGGYVRNWQNCIDYLDEHRDYYDTLDEDKINPIVRSIDLLRTRIAEVQSIVTEQKSLKELDSYFASIKEYIPAWKQDIDQRFRSLLSLVTPPSGVAEKNITSSIAHREPGRRRMGDDDDDDAPGYGRFNRNA